MTCQSSLLAETIPETQVISQPPDVTQPSDFSQDFEVIYHVVKLRRPTLESRSYPRLVDPAAVTLPLHSTPMDEAFGVQGSLGTQHEPIPSLREATISSGTNTPHSGRR